MGPGHSLRRPYLAECSGIRTNDATDYDHAPGCRRESTCRATAAPLPFSAETPWARIARSRCARIRHTVAGTETYGDWSADSRRIRETSATGANLEKRRAVLNRTKYLRTRATRRRGNWAARREIRRCPGGAPARCRV